MANAPVPRPEQESQAAHTSKRVLLVEDDPTTRMMTEGLLCHLLGCTVHTAENGKDGSGPGPGSHAPDRHHRLAHAGHGRGRVLPRHACHRLGPVDVCHHADRRGERKSKIIEAFEAGVDDYVSKPVNVRALSARMRAALHYVKLLEAWENDRTQLKQFTAELAISNRRLEHAAMTDLLTELPNRRAGMESLGRFWSASQRTGQPMAALMIDVDFFKSINDRYGHAVGDRVLQEVAKAIQSAARKDDSVSRIGGEEFLLVCHDADPRAALLAAERLRRMVKAMQINIAGMEIQTSVSIGVANREDDMNHEDDLLRAADKALYAAKKAGRDRVCLSANGKTLCAACANDQRQA
jgi:two-component system cell cycle response regulator